MAIKTTRWDSANHMKTDEDIKLYLEACIEEAGDDLLFKRLSDMPSRFGAEQKFAEY
jgi:DNA-binding phage protein